MAENVSRQITLMCVQPEQSHYAVPEDVVNRLFRLHIHHININKIVSTLQAYEITVDKIINSHPFYLALSKYGVVINERLRSYLLYPTSADWNILQASYTSTLKETRLQLYKNLALRKGLYTNRRLQYTTYSIMYKGKRTWGMTTPYWNNEVGDKHIAEIAFAKYAEIKSILQQPEKNKKPFKLTLDYDELMHIKKYTTNVQTLQKINNALAKRKLPNF